MANDDAVGRELLAHCLRHERIARKLAEQTGRGPLPVGTSRFLLVLAVALVAVVPILFLPH